MVLGKLKRWIAVKKGGGSNNNSPKAASRSNNNNNAGVDSSIHDNNEDIHHNKGKGKATAPYLDDAVANRMMVDDINNYEDIQEDDDNDELDVETLLQLHASLNHPSQHHHTLDDDDDSSLASIQHNNNNNIHTNRTSTTLKSSRTIDSLRSSHRCEDDDCNCVDHDQEEEEDEDEEDEDRYLGDGFGFNEHAGSQSFSCLSPDDLVAFQLREVRSVAELLSISSSVAGVFLRHYQWKRELLLGRYFENPAKVWAQVGLKEKSQEAIIMRSPSECSSSSSLESDHSGSGIKSSSSAGGGPSNHPHHHHVHPAVEHTIKALEIDTSCSICGEDDLKEDDCMALDCLHLFCKDCWRSYLFTKINDGQAEIKCPGHKCSAHVEDAYIRHVVDDRLFSKYLAFVTKSFIKDNRETVKWCPTPGCGNAIAMVGDGSSSGSSGVTAKCGCGFQFCFSCHREAHAPATCDQMRLWEEKNRDDSENVHWMSGNTKPCIKCHVSVEKNGGCNHMTCPQCKSEWCWVCMKSWRGHSDYYSCNRYEKQLKKMEKEKEKEREKASKKESKKEKNKRLKEEAVQQQKDSLERFIHFSTRSASHDQSRRLEEATRQTAQERIKELMEDNDEGTYTCAEVQFIMRGLDQLRECRTVLKHTYIFGYYFLGREHQRTFQETHGSSIAMKLFEDLQEDLERTTEKLSELVEGIIKATNTPHVGQSLRLETIHSTALARTKKENLLQAIASDPLFDMSYLL
eukprot:TRINITY_DN1896_c0_g1_i1.p1 TRINITY_DN1896_c0_g1~~TRINITY_DN1896_c0_g1_i1.p1  ORF type:complete len:742 (-),score=149.74 TRINITY_DN1896_c0_g1_i1:26-2251(-)